MYDYICSPAQGRSIEEAVRIAQERGFAEADPTHDLDGSHLSLSLSLSLSIYIYIYVYTISVLTYIYMTCSGIYDWGSLLVQMGCCCQAMCASEYPHEHLTDSL